MIDPNDFEASLKPKFDRGIRRRFSNRRNTNPSELPLRIHIYHKGMAYPECYVSSSVSGLMRKLKCSNEEATNLFIAKLEEILKTVENERLRERIEVKIKYLGGKPKITKKCVQCGKKFSTAYMHRVNCNKCIPTAKKVEPNV